MPSTWTLNCKCLLFNLHSITLNYTQLMNSISFKYSFVHHKHSALLLNHLCLFLCGGAVEVKTCHSVFVTTCPLTVSDYLYVVEHTCTRVGFAVISRE
jgi:hypothetical protein